MRPDLSSLPFSILSLLLFSDIATALPRENKIANKRPHQPKKKKKMARYIDAFFGAHDSLEALHTWNKRAIGSESAENEAQQQPQPEKRSVSEAPHLRTSTVHSKRQAPGACEVLVKNPGEYHSMSLLIPTLSFLPETYTSIIPRNILPNVTSEHWESCNRVTGLDHPKISFNPREASANTIAAVCLALFAALALVTLLYRRRKGSAKGNARARDEMAQYNRKMGSSSLEQGEWGRREGYEDEDEEEMRGKR